MKHLSRIFAPLMLAATLAATPALAAYSPTVPPAGWSGPVEKWTDLYNRGDSVAKFASKGIKGASTDCIRAILLKVLISTEITLSKLALARAEAAQTAVTVRAGGEQKIRSNAVREADNACSGPSGGNPVANLEALARMGSRIEDWTITPYKGKALEQWREVVRAEYERELTASYARAKPALAAPEVSAETPSTSILELIKLGVLVPAANVASKAVTAGTAIFILNPKLFQNEYNPADGI